jgi:putative transposase
VRFAFIDVEKANYAVTALCDALEVTPQGFYAWLARRECPRRKTDRSLTTHIRAIFREHRGFYGSHRIRNELPKYGFHVSRKRVVRLMRQEQLRGRRARGRFCSTTDSKHGHPIAPNILDRDFRATKLNQVWVGDITYISTGEGFLYLATVIDLCSRRVVGWSLSTSLAATLCIDALRMAIRQRRPRRGLIFHSDRGAQYACSEYRDELARYGIVQSMSRKGNCLDNAPAESFFATLKVELVYDLDLTTREQARREAVRYIEGYYNRRRLHSSIGYLSPVDFERQVAAV